VFKKIIFHFALSPSPSFKLFRFILYRIILNIKNNYHQSIVNKEYIFTFAARFKRDYAKLVETVVVKGT